MEAKSKRKKVSIVASVSAIIFFSFYFLFANLSIVRANDLLDSDSDGVPDVDEVATYKTRLDLADTDGDGYSDKEELINGFSPLNSGRVKLEDSDYDADWLSDRMELNFHTDLTNPDSDGDGLLDGEEVKNGYDPLKGEKAVLGKRIEIDTKKQELSYYLGDIRLGSFSVSTGKPSMPTPKGNFTVGNKSPKAWSKSYGLWMPYWMGMKGTRFGIHELPVWPSGYREGEDHLGTPVSHGCIRLGVTSAKTLYDWAPVGTPVYIH